jgi:4-hydroxybenzoate polyprenyltransferase
MESESDVPRIGRRSLWEKIVEEAKSRPFAWGVFVVFTVAGPVVVSWLFPEAPTAVAVVGGAIFGGYCALNAVPQKFL